MTAPIQSTYQQLEQAVFKKYRLITHPRHTYFHREIRSALANLSKALELQHSLKFSKAIYYSAVEVDTNQVMELPLDTLPLMWQASIPVYQLEIPAIEPQQIAHDSWVEGTSGRPEGFYPQPSLQDLVGMDFAAFKKVIEMPANTLNALLKKVKNAARSEILRLSESEKSWKIERAVTRLENAVDYKTTQQQPASMSLYDLEVIEKLDFDTAEKMLNAVCIKNKRSLKTALNISRYNIFSDQPLWGNTDALNTVLKKLDIQETEPVCLNLFS